MKRMTFLKWIALTALFIHVQEKLNAQLYTYQSPEIRPCLEDTSVFQINSYANGTSFAEGDLVTINLDFGDGQSTVINLSLEENGSQNFQADTIIKHHYTAIGNYATIISSNCNGQNSNPYTYGVDISTSGCQAVSGNAWVDFNDNCIVDTEDRPLNGFVNIAGSGFSTSHKIDASGAYAVFLPTTGSYNLNAYSTGWNNSFNCPNTNGSITFSGAALPLSQDFYAKSVINFQVWNWNQVFCEPSNVCFYVNGSFIGYDSLLTEVNFGDGTDSSFYHLNEGDSGGIQVCHFYQTPGIYQPEFIISGLYDADTAYSYVNFADSCGEITGTIFADLNSNCTLDGNETTIEGILVQLLENGTVIQYDYTQANGIYSFEDIPLGGNYAVQLLNNGAYLPILCPNSSGIQTVPSVPASGLDFALDAANLSGFNLSSILNIGTGFNRPGQQRYLEVCVRNLGFTSTDGTLVLELDPLLEVTGFNSPAPSNVSGNIITWDFTSLQANNPYVAYDPNGTECFSMYVLTDTTANIGDTLCLTLTANPIPGDTDPSNNVITLCAPVLNSYDPNDKSVSPSGSDANGFVAANQSMTYTVRFQNTGNAEAFNIFILDTIDTNLNLSTLEPIASSHAMDVQVTGRVVKFAFNNINLPDSNTNEPLSHGFVVYRIAQNANLQPGEMFENTAHIFFDYNPAIVTNTVVNTIEIPTKISSSTVASLEMNMYPNPAQNQVNISFETSALRNIQIRDLLGKTIQSGMYSNTQVKLDASQLSSGVYQIFVQEGDHTQVEKLIIKK